MPAPGYPRDWVTRPICSNLSQIAFFAKLPCVSGRPGGLWECSNCQLGHTVNLMPPKCVNSYV